MQQISFNLLLTWLCGIGCVGNCTNLGWFCCNVPYGCGGCNPTAACGRGSREDRPAGTGLGAVTEIKESQFYV